MKLYSSLYRILSAFLRWFYRIEIVGDENEMPQGGYLVCANHISNHDVIVLAVSLHRQLHYFAKAELFRVPLLGSLIRALGAFPVRRGAADVGAIKKTISLIRDGEVVGFYPQGHRYAGIHPSLTEPREGVGMIVCRAEADVLPVAIECKNYRMRPFKRTTVRIGKAIPYESWSVPTDENGVPHALPADYKRIARGVFGAITEMLPPPPDKTKNKK